MYLFLNRLRMNLDCLSCCYFFTYWPLKNSPKMETSWNFSTEVLGSLASHLDKWLLHLKEETFSLYCIILPADKDQTSVALDVRNLILMWLLRSLKRFNANSAMQINGPGWGGASSSSSSQVPFFPAMDGRLFAFRPSVQMVYGTGVRVEALQNHFGRDPVDGSSERDSIGSRRPISSLLSLQSAGWFDFSVQKVNNLMKLRIKKWSN